MILSIYLRSNYRFMSIRKIDYNALPPNICLIGIEKWDVEIDSYYVDSGILYLIESNTRHFSHRMCFVISHYGDKS